MRDDLLPNECDLNTVAQLLKLSYPRAHAKVKAGEIPIKRKSGNRYVFDHAVIEEIAARVEPLTLDDIGKYLGVSRQRASQLRQQGRIPAVVWSTQGLEVKPNDD